jgi:putative ABC transport system permease protein
MLHDLSFALRLWTRNPGTTVVAVVALGLGIGMSTAMFNAFSALLLRPMPFVQEEQRVVSIRSQQLSRPDQLYPLSMPDFLDLREQSRTLEGFSTFYGRTMILASGDTPERVLSLDISADAFAMLGAKPYRGRLFTSDDGEPAAEPVAIISHALWQGRFGGREDAVGRVEIMNGRPTTIVGVMPPGFSFPERHAMWTPLRHVRDPAARSSHGLPGLARLRPGVSLDEARTELAALGARLAQEYPATNTDKGFIVVPLREQETAEERLLVHLMLGAALLVLLIACANVANLLLALATSRAHESCDPRGRGSHPRPPHPAGPDRESGARASWRRRRSARRRLDRQPHHRRHPGDRHARVDPLRFRLAHPRLRRRDRPRVDPASSASSPPSTLRAGPARS